LFGHKKGETYSITLNVGQVYVLAASDVYSPSSLCCFQGSIGKQIGGTKLTSDKLITITYSDDSISFPNIGCQDLNGDQLLPTNLSGNEYITLPGSLNLSITGENVTDIVYIYPTMDSTSLKINGKLIEYKKNIGDYFYLLNKGEINYFESDKPVLVYQLSGNGCEVGGAVIPEISRTGLNFSSATRITGESLIINLLMESKYTTGLTIEGLKSEILLNWKNIGEKWAVASLDLSDSKFINPNETIYFKNELGPFHLGMIHGGGGSGTRFGFFSNFSIALDNKILTASCRDELAVFSISDPRGTSGYWQISEDNSLTWKDIDSSLKDYEISGTLSSTLRIKNKAFFNGLLVRYVEVKNSGKIYSYPSRLYIECPTINFSNVITRNNDSKNDKFIAKGIENFQSNELIIFDRWGNHVYKTKDYQNDWGGEGLVAGTYYYILRLEDKNRNLIEYKGWVQLITK
jgi:gliding motility-associated-like protein